MPDTTGFLRGLSIAPLPASVQVLASRGQDCWLCLLSPASGMDTHPGAEWVTESEHNLVWRSPGPICAAIRAWERLSTLIPCSHSPGAEDGVGRVPICPSLLSLRASWVEDRVSQAAAAGTQDRLCLDLKDSDAPTVSPSGRHGAMGRGVPRDWGRPGQPAHKADCHSLWSCRASGCLPGPHLLHTPLHVSVWPQSWGRGPRRALQPGLQAGIWTYLVTND